MRPQPVSKHSENRCPPCRGRCSVRAKEDSVTVVCIQHAGQTKAHPAYRLGAMYAVHLTYR